MNPLTDQRYTVLTRYAPTIPPGQGAFYVYDRKWSMQVGRSHRTRETAQRVADARNRAGS